MNTITREELKAKLDRGDHFKLVMTLTEWHFRAMHIPSSIWVSSVDDALSQLGRDEEIVVYCADVNCVASGTAYHLLTDNGYRNVRRYAGGVADWQAAGYPLVGEMVEA
ncbi:MAG: rhodanese-like domain-containing protein [Aggregatilineales bacterium]